LNNIEQASIRQSKISERAALLKAPGLTLSPYFVVGTVITFEKHL
jgi:hypothetical protein